MGRSSGTLGERDPQQTAFVRGLDARGIDRSRERDIDLEQSLADARDVVGGRARSGNVPAALDDDCVLEEVDLEVVLVDAGQGHDGFDGVIRLVDGDDGRPEAMYEDP